MVMKMVMVMVMVMLMVMMMVIKREYKLGVEAAGGERRWRVKLDFQEVQLVRHHSLASLVSLEVGRTKRQKTNTTNTNSQIQKYGNT